MANDSVIDQKVVRGIDPSGNVRNVQVDAGGNIVTTGGTGGIGVSSTATITAVSASTTVAVVEAANTARKGLIIQNEGPQPGLVAYSSAATSSSYTFSIPNGGYWEMPSIFTGPLSVITASSTATLRVTELT